VTWRSITGRTLAEAMGRLTLPLLALPAAYGVGSFQRLFVPDVMAAINAAAFEFVYISIALLPNLERRRAGWVAAGSVLVSVLNNTLSGWFHTAPGIFATMDIWHWLALAILHGAPLAIIAYLFAELLMDRNRDAGTRRGDGSIPPTITEFVIAWRQRLPDLSVPELAKQIGIAERTARHHLQSLPDAGRTPEPTEPEPDEAQRGGNAGDRRAALA